MSPIDAIYRDGVFRPLGAVTLAENQAVRLLVEPIEATSILQWIDEAQKLQAAIRRRSGVLPDSASSIAEDRLRDA